MVTVRFPVLLANPHDIDEKIVRTLNGVLC